MIRPAWLSLFALLPSACSGGDGGGAPGAPSFGGATGATGLASAIRVEWSPASDDVTSPDQIEYLVFMAQGDAAIDFSTPVRETTPGAGDATVGPLDVSTSYRFVVRARDTDGNVDDNDVEVGATTLDVADETPPEFGGVKSVTAAGSTALAVAWAAASDDVTPPEDIVYQIYLGTGSGAENFGSVAAASDPGALSATVGGLDPLTTYFVVVRAVDALGNEDTGTVEASAMTAAPVTLSGDVQPVFTQRCSGAGCHGGPAPAEGMDLSAGSAYASTVGVPANQCSDRMRVAAGDPAASYLIDKIDGDSLCLGTQMPKTGTLPADERQIILDWIAQGAPND